MRDGAPCSCAADSGCDGGGLPRRQGCGVGLTVGLLPGGERSAANPFVDVALPTGLGEVRNAVLVRAAEAVIAVGGGYGTLSEIAFALRRRASRWWGWRAGTSRASPPRRRPGRRSPWPSAPLRLGAHVSFRTGGGHRGPPAIRPQSETPYLDALQTFRARKPRALSRAGSQGRSRRGPRPHRGPEAGRYRRHSHHSPASTSAEPTPSPSPRSWRPRGMGRQPHLVARERGLQANHVALLDGSVIAAPRWRPRATRLRRSTPWSAGPATDVRGSGARPGAAHRPA